MKARDFKHNKRMGQPENLQEDEEILILNQRRLTHLAFRDFQRENKITKAGSNLTKSEFLGWKEVQKGVKTKGWLLGATDKSERLVLDTKEN